jgi:hypothetical protein
MRRASLQAPQLGLSRRSSHRRRAAGVLLVALSFARYSAPIPDPRSEAALDVSN